MKMKFLLHFCFLKPMEAAKGRACQNTKRGTEMLYKAKAKKYKTEQVQERPV